MKWFNVFFELGSAYYGLAKQSAKRRIHDFGVKHDKTFHVAESHGPYLLLATMCADWSHLTVLGVCIGIFAVMTNIVES